MAERDGRKKHQDVIAAIKTQVVNDLENQITQILSGTGFGTASVEVTFRDGQPKKIQSTGLQSKSLIDGQWK